MDKGFILTTYNDIDLVEKAYDSHLRTVKGAHLFVIVDAGSTDKTKDFCDRQGALGPFIDLSVGLNKGIERCLQKHCDYIFWIHADMTFTEDWDEKLIEYLKKNPTVGKVAPSSVHSPGEDRPGNDCPWCVPKGIFQKLHLADGYWFDENFKGIGGYEDWDLNKRIMNLGYDIRITPTSLVEHMGAGTRFAPGRNTDPEARMNAGYYQQKHGECKNPI